MTATRRSFVATSSSAAAPDAVFALLAAGDRWAEWAGPVVPRSRWAVPGDPVGTVGAVRRLGIGPLSSLERIVEHEPGRRLGYVVDSAAPMRGYRAVVDLAPRTDGGTDITWSASFEPVVPGTGPVLHLVLRGIVRGFAKRVARAAA